jgi:hypothetical protein
LESPLLLEERKFDIRVWVLLTHDYKLYWFREGYLRMTALKFTLDSRSISDPEMHLTNNAVQSKMKNYGKYEDGNILSFDSLRARLLEMDRDPHLVDDKLLPAMSKII